MPHFWAIINSRFLLWRCRQCLWRRRSRCWMHFICFHFQVDICLFMPRKKTVLCFTRRRRRCRHMKSPPFSIPSFNGFGGIKPRWIMENFTQDDKSVMGLEVLKQDGSHNKLSTRLDLYPGVGRSWPGKRVRCYLFPSNGCSAITSGDS